MLKYLLVCIALVFSSNLLAQSIIVNATDPSFMEWVSLFKSLGGLSGASGLAIAALIVQGLMLVMRSKLGDFAGIWKLAIMYALTMISGVISLKMNGVDWLAAIMHSNTLAMAQVFGHQVFKQVKEKPATIPSAPASPQS